MKLASWTQLWTLDQKAPVLCGGKITVYHGVFQWVYAPRLPYPTQRCREQLVNLYQEYWSSAALIPKYVLSELADEENIAFKNEALFQV